MPADFLLIFAKRLALCACVITIAPGALARAADTSARIALLAAGERASVVVEFDNEVPKATAIEAPDSRTFAAEIGPVHSKIANQLLQAATPSPLVSEVRVLSVQGAQGTLITLHVTAKTAVSGFVRRAQRRIYIDLEPLSMARQGRGASQNAASSRVTAPTRGPGSTSSGIAVPSMSAAIQPGLPELHRATALYVWSLFRLRWSGSVIAQLDEYLVEARKNRVSTDARLFQDPPFGDGQS